MSRTNDYTFFYPASTVWRSKIKIGCPNFAVKVEFVKKRCYLFYVRKAVNWLKMFTHTQKVGLKGNYPLKCRAYRP